MNIREYECGLKIALEILQKDTQVAYNAYREEVERLNLGFFGDPGDCQVVESPSENTVRTLKSLGF